MVRRILSPIPLRFRGMPTAVEGLVPLAHREVVAGGVSCELRLPSVAQAGARLQVQTAPAGSSATSLLVSLPESTPPGTYEGALRIGGDQYPIVADVDPHPYVLLSPSRLSLQAAPGAEMVVDLTIVNTGNVAWEVPKAHGFGLFDVAGAERGIGAAFRDAAGKGQERLHRLADELADSHGGLVRAAIQQGAGALAPGELRALRVTLRFPDRLKPGHTYSGTWPLLNLRYYVRVQVTGKIATEKES